MNSPRYKNKRYLLLLAGILLFMFWNAKEQPEYSDHIVQMSIEIIEMDNHKEYEPIRYESIWSDYDWDSSCHGKECYSSDSPVTFHEPLTNSFVSNNRIIDLYEPEQYTQYLTDTIHVAQWNLVSMSYWPEYTDIHLHKCYNDKYRLQNKDRCYKKDSKEIIAVTEPGTLVLSMMGLIMMMVRRIRS